MLFLLFAGAAFSVCAGELLWRAPLKKGEWLFSGTASGTYSSTASNNPLYNEIKGDFAIETKYSFAQDFDFGVNVPVHLDYISTEFNDYTKSSGGIGDPQLSILWSPTTAKKVAPVLGITSSFPIGSNTKGALPRYNLQYSGDFPFYTNDNVVLAPSIGLNASLLTLDFSYRFRGSIQLNSNWYSTIENHFLVGHSVSDKIDIQFGFEIISPIATNSSLIEIDGPSAVVKPGVEIALNENTTLQTAVILGITNNNVSRYEASYATTPDIGLSFTLDIRKGKRESDDVSEHLDSVILDTIVTEPLTTTDTAAVQDSIETTVLPVIEPILVIDSDGDGIPDTKDLCNDEQELFNGIDDEDGCEDFSNNETTNDQDSFLLTGVAFESGSTELNRSSEISLRPLIAILEEKPSQKIELRGFSDHSGGYDINISISQKRANAVKAYLIENGIIPSRVTAIGFGANSPMADNRTSSGRKKNRRIEYIITN